MAKPPKNIPPPLDIELPAIVPAAIEPAAAKILEKTQVFFNRSMRDPDGDDGDVASRPGTLASPPGVVHRPDMATIYGARRTQGS
jgi:hypothetical protein